MNEDKYSVTDVDGDELKFKTIYLVAIYYGEYEFRGFEGLRNLLDEKYNVKLKEISDVDEREQAIYARMAKVKRPKPKEFKVGDLVECIGESNGHDVDKTYGGGGWRKGRRFIVTGITDKNIYWGKISGGVYAHHLKLIGR